MEEKTKKCCSMMQLKGHKVCGAFNVETSSGSFWKKERIIVLTNLCMAIFEKSKEKPKNEYIWQDICDFSMSLEIIHVKFGKKMFRIRTKSVIDLYSSIIDIITHVLLESELRNIGITPPKSVSKSESLFSSVSRLENLKNGAKKEETQIIIEKFKEILLFSSPYLTLSDYCHNSEAVEIIFNVLPLCKTVFQLHVVEIPGIDVMERIIKLFKSKCYIQTLIIELPITEKLFDLINALFKGDNILSGLFFKGCLLNQKVLEALSLLYSSRGISSFGSYSSIETSSIDYFYTSFLKKSMSSQLTVLCLDNTKNLNLSVLMTSIPSVLILSLINCELEISSIFKSIFESPLLRLSSIILNGNHSINPVDEFRTLPLSLNSISADSVNWSEGCLVPFLRLVLKSFSSGIRLSLSKSSTSIEEWVRVFGFLCQARFSSLSAFIWDYNPIMPKLFEFLEQHPSLELLSMNGCFNQTYANPISSFIDYISKGPKLKSLHIQGTENSNIGTFSSRIIEALKNCPLIEFLDISMNYGGDEFVSAVKNLCSSRSTLKTLCLDGIKPNNIKGYYEGIAHLCSKENLQVSYPLNDVQYLESNKSLNHDQRKKFDKLFVKKSLKPKSKDKNSAFNEKVSIYKYASIPHFPIMLTTKEFTNLQIMNKTQLNLNNTKNSMDTIERLNQRMSFGRATIPSSQESDQQILSSQKISTNESPQNPEKNRKTTKSKKSTSPHETISKIVERIVPEIEITDSDNREKSPDIVENDLPQQFPSPVKRQWKKPELNIEPNWTFPTVKIVVDIEAFWDHCDESYSIQNLYKDIREEKIH